MISLLAITLGTASIQVEIDPNNVVTQVSKDLYGIFFEEINCAGDGGIYPEMIRNRSFEDSRELSIWTAKGKATAQNGVAKLEKGATLTNPGFFGMHRAKGDKYRFSIRYSAAEKTNLDITLGSTVKTLSLPPAQAGFKTIQLQASETTNNGTIELQPDQNLDIDFVSLYPTKTFKNRENGLRPDLMRLLKDMKPAFMRFPGGCWVEGETMDLAMRWKTTIGDLHLRRTQPNIWGYVSTNGLGYHEYLQMCEDLDTAALFVVNVGMSHREVVPMDKMGEYVQDALDAIEYARGPVTSFWGAKRAQNGHPKPFNLKYLEIGNENGGPAYNERYKLFFDAVKAKYPEVTTIANVWGGVPNSAPLEVIDEHYYYDPSFFFRNANRYDTYDRKGPKVYVGEYAVTRGAGIGNLISALSEAAFMTGMERNSDIVTMSSYAPLFANVGLKAWNPDLIYFDGSRAAGTPSYHVQKLFSLHRPTEVVRSTLSSKEETHVKFPTGGIGVGTWITQAEFKDIEVTENGVTKKIDPTQLQRQRGDWTVAEGIAKQTSLQERCRMIFPMPNSSTYKLKVKARKLGGNEGFLITVGHHDPESWVWLNLGGWRNTEHGVEFNGGGRVGRNIPGVIETGKWYDIEIDYSPSRIACWLDGKQIFDEKAPSNPTFFETAGIDRKTGELVVKLVNGANAAKTVEVNLGNSDLNKSAKLIEMSHSNPMAENTLDNPWNVAPKNATAQVRKGKMTVEMKPNSLVIARIKL